MKNHKPQATVPESWKIAEKEIDEAWKQKTQQFAQFKNHFSALFAKPTQ